MKFSIALLFALLVAFCASPAAALRGSAEEKDNRALEAEAKAGTRSLEAVYANSMRKLTEMQAHENYRKLVRAEAEVRNLVDAKPDIPDADFKRRLTRAEATFHAFAKIDEQYRKLVSFADDEEGPESAGSGRALQSTRWQDVDNDDWVPLSWILYGGANVDSTVIDMCTFCDQMDDDDEYGGTVLP